MYRLPHARTCIRLAPRRVLNANSSPRVLSSHVYHRSFSRSNVAGQFAQEPAKETHQTEVGTRALRAHTG